MTCSQLCTSSALISRTGLSRADARTTVTARRQLQKGASCTIRRRSETSTSVRASADTAVSVSDQTEEDTDVLLEYGQSGLQGPRDGMEDYTSVIEHGRCGFMVACKLSSPSLLVAITWSFVQQNLDTSIGPAPQKPSTQRIIHLSNTI